MKTCRPRNHVRVKRSTDAFTYRSTLYAAPVSGDRRDHVPKPRRATVDDRDTGLGHVRVVGIGKGG